jgi:tetratricopeptide (TPR) repeat protein
MMTGRFLLAAIALVLPLAGCSRDPEVAKRRYLESGNQYSANKQHKEAIVEYRNAVKQDPRFGDARLKLAESLVETGDFQNAYREYVRAADLLPSNVTAQMRAGELLLLGQQFEGAKARADIVLAIDPKHVEALILRANALAGLNKLDDAIAEIEEAMRVAPDRGATYASLGALQMLRDNRGEAELSFLQAVKTAPRSIPARLALARFYTTTGRPAEAEEHLKEAVALGPKDRFANQAMAYYFLGMKRAAEAEQSLKVVAESAPAGLGKLALADYYIALQRYKDASDTLVTIDPAHTESYSKAKLRLAALGLSDGDAAGARRLVDEVLAKNPSHAEALVAKAHLLAQERKLDEALNSVQTAAQVAPRSAQAHFAVGQIQLARRDTTAALAAFNQAVQLNPRLTVAEVRVAGIHLRAGRLNEAEQFLQSALKKTPGYVEARLMLARVQMLSGRADAAERGLTALVAALPNSADVHTEIGFLYLMKQNRRLARASLERATSINPAQLEALSVLSRMDIEEHRPDTAKARVERAMSLHPDDTRLMAMGGAMLSTTADAREGEKLLRSAIEKDPDNLEAYEALARLYVRQRRIDEAIKEFDNVAQRQPGAVQAHTIIGLLLDLQSRRAEAKARYQKALEIDAQAAVAANNLAWIYTEEGENLAEALQLAQTAKQVLPGEPRIDDTLGWIYVKKKMPESAIRHLETSVKQMPKNPDAHYHLGMAYFQTGNVERAKVALKRTLQLKPDFSGAADARSTLATLGG